MSSHVYHEIFLHFNWHVKHDRPVLRDEIETAVHNLIEERCRKTKGFSFMESTAPRHTFILP